MARQAPQNKDHRKTGKNKASAAASSDGNRTLLLVLAGFTAIVIIIIAIVAIVSASGGGDAENFTPNDDGLIPVGKKAPDFSAKALDGGKVSLADGGSKKATMLVFFATWCPHCQAEAPVIADFVDQYKDLQIDMIGMDGQDNQKKVGEFVDKYGIDAPTTYDPPLGTTYKVSGYPTVYILDGKGKVVFAHSGEAPRKIFESNIEKALG